MLQVFDSIYQSISYVRMGQTMWIIHINPVTVKDSRSPKKCGASSHGFCLYFLPKKMPCLIRNNHKFGERKTSCCVTSWEVKDHLDVAKDCEAVETLKEKKWRTPDFWGLIFPPQKLGETLITYLGFD